MNVSLGKPHSHTKHGTHTRQANHPHNPHTSTSHLQHFTFAPLAYSLFQRNAFLTLSLSLPLFFSLFAFLHFSSLLIPCIPPPHLHFISLFYSHCLFQILSLSLLVSFSVCHLSLSLRFFSLPFLKSAFLFARFHFEIPNRKGEGGIGRGREGRVFTVHFCSTDFWQKKSKQIKKKAMGRRFLRNAISVRQKNTKKRERSGGKNLTLRV